jgi:hypothetical protein
MRLHQRVRDLHGEVERLAEHQSPVPNPLGHRLALDVLHDDEIATAVFANFVDGADVWVVERGHGPRFAKQALARALVSDRLLRQDFDRYLASKAFVHREIDLAHPARAEQFKKSVMAEEVSDY